MELVVDTNVLIAAILRPGFNRQLVLSGQLCLYSPLYFLAELSANEDELLSKSRVGRFEFEGVFNQVVSAVEASPALELNPYSSLAHSICPHSKDWPFFAAALLKNCGIWSFERRFNNQNQIPVYSTADLAYLF